MRKRISISGLLLAIGISSALAQSGAPIKQSGNITPNTVPWWITSGVIGSGVTAVDSPISSFGATGPICSNSARQVSGAWQSLCIQANASGPATITLQNNGSAPQQSLVFVINGLSVPYPPSSSGLPLGWITPQSVGAKCDGITDDAAALQLAVNSLPITGGVIYTPPGSICLSSQPVAISTNFDGVTLLGVSNFNERIFSPSVWKYTGTGARFIDARESRGFKIQGLSVKYTSIAGFTGKLVDLGALTPPGPTQVSGFPSLIDVNLGPDTHRTGTATLVDASSTVGLLISRVYFEHGKPAIHGQSVLDFNTVTTIQSSFFMDSEGPPIIECGQDWLITGNAFENISSGQGAAFLGSVSLPCKAMSWKSNWFGDYTAGGGTLLDGAFLGLDFSTNTVLGAVAGQTGIVLRSSSGVSVTNNYMENMTTAVNCASSDVAVQVSYNKFVSVTTQVANPSGCSGLNTDNNDPPAPQPWTSYTCTATAQTPGGTPPTFTVNDCRYYLAGTSVTARADVTITAAGTGSGGIQITLPFTAAAFKYVGSSIEYVSTGVAGGCLVVVSGTTMSCSTATGATYIVTGRGIVGEIQYEKQ